MFYPGFIAANTTLGLVEVGAVRPTRDNAEIGDLIPHVRALIAYNAESKVVESMRPNGILTAQVRPVGGTISGDVIYYATGCLELGRCRL